MKASIENFSAHAIPQLPILPKIKKKPKTTNLRRLIYFPGGIKNRTQNMKQKIMLVAAQVVKI